MGSLFEELEAREVAARTRVEELEAELAELSGKLELARESQIEGTRSRLKRLVERGWLDEDTPGMFTPAADGRTNRPTLVNSRALPRLHSKVRPNQCWTGRALEMTPYEIRCTADPFARSLSAFETLMHTLSGSPARA